jgi:acetoin utilization deacetylase AcuC-like enzyme
MEYKVGGYGAIRPPGHHAHENYPSGFGYFNNVAVAA